MNGQPRREASVTGLQELRRKADEFLEEIKKSKDEDLKSFEFSEVLACGGQGVVFLGTFEKTKAVAKVPVEYIEQCPDALEGADVADFSRILEGPAEECRRYDEPELQGIFPKKLFPEVGQDPLLILKKNSVLLPLLIMEYAPGLSLREVLLCLRDRSFARAGSEQERELSDNRESSILAWMLMDILKGLRKILGAGGLYLDLAPENFRLGKGDRSAVILDAGSIVERTRAGRIPVRTGLLPAGWAGRLSEIPGLDGEEIGMLQLKMLARAVASLLLGIFPNERWEPSPTRVAAKAPCVTWLREFLERSIGDGENIFRTTAEAVDFLEAQTRRDAGGLFPARASSLGSVGRVFVRS